MIPLRKLVSVSVTLPWFAAAFAVPRYDVRILPEVVGFESVFPSDRSGGLVVATAGTDRFDPLGAPFIWDGAAWTPLDPPGSSSFPARFGSPSLVCGTTANEPVVWQSGVRSTLAPAEGLPGGSAHDANASGSIVGAAINDLLGTEFPAFWASPTSPGLLLRTQKNSSAGAAHAVNDGGDIAGTSDGQPVLWAGPKRQARRIAPPTGGIGGELLAINENGDAAGRATFADGSSKAMLYTAATRDSVALGSFGGTFSSANDLNDSRQVVGTSSSPIGPRAFLWDGRLFDLNALVVSTNAPFLALVDAVEIDNAGNITATAAVDSSTGVVTRAAILVPVGGLDVEEDGFSHYRRIL